jgi:hypothetical protein
MPLLADDDVIVHRNARAGSLPRRSVASSGCPRATASGRLTDDCAGRTVNGVYCGEAYRKLACDWSQGAAIWGGSWWLFPRIALRHFRSRGVPLDHDQSLASMSASNNHLAEVASLSNDVSL